MKYLNFFQNTKALSSVVAVALLLVATVIAIVAFQEWYQQYSSALFTDVETGASVESFTTGVQDVIGDKLYFKNGGTTNITVNSVEIDGVDCQISSNVSKGIKSFNINSCTNTITTDTPEVVVYTDKGVFSKKMYLEKTEETTFSKILSASTYANGKDIIESENGYIVTGLSDAGSVGGWDSWIMRYDYQGNLKWNFTYGSTTDEDSVELVELDNSYIVSGYNKSSGDFDLYLMKTLKNGSLEWKTNFKGNTYERGNKIIGLNQTNFLVFGTTDDSSISAGQEDFLLLNYDFSGNLLWNKTYGGSTFEEGENIIKTSDGGYLLTGDRDLESGNSYDIWVVKLNSTFEQQWNKTFSTSGSDHVREITQHPNGDISIYGYTNGLGNDDQIWIIKTNSTGDELWNKTYGGAGSEVIKNGLYVEDDNNIYISAVTTSYGNGGEDGWILKVDSNGNHLWNNSYGGVSDDRFYSIIKSSQGGLVTTGYSSSYGSGSEGLWVLKLTSNGQACDYESNGGVC